MRLVNTCEPEINLLAVGARARKRKMRIMLCVLFIWMNCNYITEGSLRASDFIKHDDDASDLNIDCDESTLAAAAAWFPSRRANIFRCGKEEGTVVAVG